MTPEAQLALIAAIPTYLASLGALFASVAVLVQAFRNSEAKKSREIVSGKIDDLKQTTDRIHVDTNANLTEMTKKWEAAIEQTKGLEATVKTLLDRGIVSAPPPVRVEPTPALAYDDLLKEMTELKAIMAKFATTGMPVIAPAGEPLPVKVEVVSKK